MDKTILNDKRTPEHPDMDHLFHYTSMPVALEHILGRGMLRFSPLFSTDDPLEFAPPLHISVGGNRDEMLKIQAGEPEVEKLLSKAKIACFCQSEKTVDRFRWGTSRSRMWSQYGEGHKGVCLVFSKDELLRSIPQKYLDNEAFFHRGVDYENRVRNRLIRDSDVDPVQRVQQSALQYFFQKREDYRDENEYRMVLCDTDDSPGEYIQIPCLDALRAVVLGSRANRCYHDNFLGFGRQYSVEVLKISWGGSDVYFKKPQPFQTMDDI